MISNNQTEGGYGLRLHRISLRKSISLYSYLGETLHMLPSTEDSAKSISEERAKTNPFIQSNLEVSNVAFFAKPAAGSYISSIPVCPGYYRVVGPNGGELFPGVQCVDVGERDLLKYSNAPSGEESILDAITMFDFASAAGSVSLYVVSTRSYKQVFMVNLFCLVIFFVLHI